MVRLRLKNRWLKERSEDNKAKYHRQRNYSLSLLRATKKRYFATIEENNLADARKFWKTVKPFFSNKSSKSEALTLIENEEIISKENEVAQIFGKYYSNIIPNLNLPVPPSLDIDPSGDGIDDCIIKYREHPSIIEIKGKGFEEDFNFRHSTKNEVEKIIKRLSTSKSQPSSDIPVKIVKRYSSTFAHFMSANINNSIDFGLFPDTLKVADRTPAYKKKGSKSDKTNYRPISILPILSKIYERVMIKSLTIFQQS